MSSTNVNRWDNTNRLAALACGLSLLVCFLQGWTRSRGGMDLPWYVYPARLWMAGSNPYDVASAQAQFPAEWRAPGMQYSCALAPQAFLQMAPFAALPWAVTLKAWWLVSFGSLLLSFWLLIRLFGARWSPASQLWFVAIIAQSKVIQSVAYRGQLSLFCLALSLLALYLASRRRPAWAGLSLAAVGVKFILAPPVVLYWLWKREWKPLAWFAGWITLLNAIPLMRLGVMPTIRTMLPSFRYYSAWEAGLHGGSSHVMNWAEIYEWVFGRGNTASAAGAVTLLAAGACVWAVLRQRRDDRDGWAFATIVVFSLIAAYHRVYDGVFVFVVAACIWDNLSSGRARSVAVYATGAATALFLFGTSVQTLASSAEAWLKAHRALSIFAPFNAWLGIVLFALTVVSAMATPRRNRELHLPQKEAEPALVA